MFSRVDYDSFQLIFPVIGFILIAGGFLYFVLRAIFMKKNKVDHMASLPLNEEKKKPKKGPKSDAK